MNKTDFNEDRMYTWLKGFFTAMEWNDALNALTFAKKAHSGQTRKNGQPYIIHPLTITCHILALNIKDEVIVASALLHDVCEDCGVKPEELPVKNDKIIDTVRRLTHVKPTPLTVYYTGIAESPYASILKLFDRCDNVSTMAGVFTDEKVKSYIREANEYVMPLYRKVKSDWPQYSSQLFVLKYHIQSVDNSLLALLDNGEPETPAPETNE